MGPSFIIITIIMAYLPTSGVDKDGSKVKPAKIFPVISSRLPPREPRGRIMRGRPSLPPVCM